MKAFRLAALVLLLAPPVAEAACLNPAGIEGDLIYNSTHHMMQFCNDADWIAMAGRNLPACTDNMTAECSLTAARSASDPQFTPANIANGVNILGVTGSFIGGGCIAPASCPNIGNLCDDGNAGTTNDPIFAGFMLYGSDCKPLYVTRNDQSGSPPWATSSGSDHIATDSNADGKINDGQVPDSTTFPAFKLCKGLTDGGFNDWYLPARNEMYHLFENAAAIGNMSANDYWSSTESSTTQAWAIRITTGGHVLTSKTGGSLKTRCVRRD